MGRATLTPLERIETSGGEVMRALRADDDGFAGVAEAYFSRVDPLAIRAWKRHAEMTVNVVVPHGHVRFVVATDDRFEEFDLGPEHLYARLTIIPETWFGFQGGEHGGLVLNLSNILHRSDESDGCALDAFDYDWRNVSDSTRPADR